MSKSDFNTLDNLVDSNHWKEMVEQATSSIKAMQTNVAKPTISPSVVLPVFQKKENAQYVIIVAGEPKGPFSLVQIQQMIKTGLITEDYYIWTNGWSEWKFIKDVLK